jgi:hypothetical protein
LAALRRLAYEASDKGLLSRPGQRNTVLVLEVGGDTCFQQRTYQIGTPIFKFRN